MCHTRLKEATMCKVAVFMLSLVGLFALGGVALAAEGDARCQRR